MAAPKQAPGLAFWSDAGRINPTFHLGFLVTAGLLNTLIAAFLLCRLPGANSPSLGAVFARALTYVFGAAVAGVAGAWFYWRRTSIPFRSDLQLSFGLFALTNAAGWVWAPSLVLLSSQDSPVSATIAVLGAAILAAGLRKTIPTNTLHQHLPDHGWASRELFDESLQSPPHEAHGFVIAICIYAAAWALHDRLNLVASALFALSAFVIAWKLTLYPISENENRRTRASLRLGGIASAAVLVTFFALLLGVSSRNRAAGAALTRGMGNGSNGSKQDSRHPTVAGGTAGYQSIILWPVPEKKEILAPIPRRTSPFAAIKSKPLVIRFNGPYWYFQAPGKRPGPRAHIDHGSPLAVDIHSNSSVPLTMEAHQRLGAAILLASCREIQVAIDNRDNRPGTIALGILLTDSAARGEPALYLGQQPVVSSGPGHFSLRSPPASEVLRFPIPDHASVRKFDEITVVFLPDPQHFGVGRKIAIRQFELLPR